MSDEDAMKRFIIVTMMMIVNSCLILGQGNNDAGPTFFPSPTWDSTGRYLIIAYQNYAQVVDSVLSKVVFTLVGHDDVINSVAWNPTQNVIATASRDHTIKVWNGEDGSLIRTLTGHNESFLTLAWSLDGSRLVGSDLEVQPNLYVWDTASGSLLSTHVGGTYSDIAFNNTGTRLAAVTPGGSLDIFDGITLERISTYIPTTIDWANNISVVSWSNDDSQLITGSIGGIIYIWNANTLQPITTFSANDYYEPNAFIVAQPNLSSVRDVAFSPDGNSVFAVSGDGTVREWNVNNGSLMQETQVSPLATASWSPYAGRIAYLESAFLQTEPLSSIQIIVPDPSLERFQAMAAACGAEQLIGESVTDAALPAVITDLQIMTDEQIPPACAADLLAIAQALQNDR
jgi:WD40 repeat protein